MATKRPLVADSTGTPREITSPDTIDPSVLPSSGSYPPTVLAAASTFSIPTNSQVLIARKITCGAGARIVGAAGGVLIGVT